MIELVSEIEKHLGRVVTIFTNSGGISGCGFTGVLLSVNKEIVRILVCIGQAPTFFINSKCSRDSINFNGENPLGAITIIPICHIVAFTHNAI